MIQQPNDSVWPSTMRMIPTVKSGIEPIMNECEIKQQLPYF